MCLSWFFKKQKSVHTQTESILDLESIQKNITELVNQSHAQASFLKTLEAKLSDIYSSLSGLYFDNDAIKHQIILEEELRKCQSELDSVKSQLQLINKHVEQQTRKQ